MMKLWKYIYYNKDNHQWDHSHLWKTPLIWMVNQPSINGVPDNDYEDITTLELLKEREVDQHLQRMDDGMEKYISVAADLRLSRLQSGGSVGDWYNLVYSIMTPVITQVQSGDWLNAHIAIDSASTTLANGDPNPIFTPTMKLGFKIMIANYICNEGQYDEHLNSTVDAVGNIVT